MGTLRRVALAVLGVLVLASVVFGLRSWVGLAPADETAAPTSSRTAAPTPSESPSATPQATATPKATATPRTKPKPRRTPEPSPQPTVNPRMSTATAAAFVKARLDRKGRATVVSCPPSVPAYVGTRFTCAVAYADAPADVVADAAVTVTGPGGSVRFVSVSR